jgi:hypothetical protein
MNCDDVFAILTRGPFPAGDRHDQFVEAHLQLCPDCQRLAEALRPNDENRPEAVAPEDSMSLPGYWGGPLRAEARPVVSLTPRTGQTRPQSKSLPARLPAARGRRISIWQFLSAVALGIVMAAVLRTLVGPATPAVCSLSSSPGGFATGNGSPSLPNFAGHELIENLPSVCLRGSSAPADDSFGANSDLSFQSSRYLLKRCCIECHGPGGAGNLGDDNAFARFQQQCVLCHKPG